MRRESFLLPRRSAPTHRDRFFFALRPPAREARRALAFAEGALGPGWQLQTPPRLHVTLAITEDFDEAPGELVQRLSVIGDRVAAAPFMMTLDRLSISHRSAALRPGNTLAGLSALYKAIRAEWTAARIAMRDDWTFSPHLTLGYREGNAPLSRPVEPFGWHADELVLIRSLVGRTVHETLGQWPLRPAASPQYTLF